MIQSAAYRTICNMADDHTSQLRNTSQRGYSTHEI
jgi:hypothetical protein